MVLGGTLGDVEFIGDLFVLLAVPDHLNDFCLTWSEWIIASSPFPLHLNPVDTFQTTGLVYFTL